MKKIKLPINNRVTFNKEEHTYTLSDGTQLSGITNIIHKFLFPCMYDGVSDAVMQAARERGSEIHEALEQYIFHGVAYKEDYEFMKELDSVGKLFVDNKLTPIAGEYLVSSTLQLVATCIDAVVQMKKGIALIDYKTTSVLYTEYLQWQLSIEAELFEAQTGMKVDKLYAIHLPKKGDAKLVEIERIPTEHIEALLKAYANDDLIFNNPLHELSDETTDLLKQYKEAELSLVELQASVDYYKKIQSDIKARIKEQMDSASAIKWESADATITRTKDSVRRTFKPEKMREIATPEVNTWLDENIDKCYSETKINGNITIKFK